MAIYLDMSFKTEFCIYEKEKNLGQQEAARADQLPAQSALAADGVKTLVCNKVNYLI